MSSRISGGGAETRPLQVCFFARYDSFAFFDGGDGGIVQFVLVAEKEKKTTPVSPKVALHLCFVCCGRVRECFALF